MSIIKTTEPEFKAQLEGWLNELLKETGAPFESVSSESSLKFPDTTKHPDLVFWTNRSAGQAFANWEMKGPEISAEDPELIADALAKARFLKVNYFLTFNLIEACLWRVPGPGLEITRAQLLKSWRVRGQISSREDFQSRKVQAELKDLLLEMVLDLAKIQKDDTLFQQEPDTFFVTKITEAATQLFPLLQKSLIENGIDRKFKDQIYQWAVLQGIPHFGDEASFQMLARQMAYRLLGKIIFYQTLQRYQPALSKLELKDVRDFSKRLQEYFAEALSIDYQAIFEQDLPDRIPLPKEAQPILVNLIEDLERYDLAHQPQEIVGSIFEKMIPVQERHRLGQYFTPENLVDLILAFTLRSATDYILDPTCGTGTFLIRAYDRFRFMGKHNHNELLEKIWGVDLAPFPAELATINLYRQNLSDFINFPRIIVKDFFELKPEQEFKFPPPRPSSDPEFRITEKNAFI